MQRRYFWLLIAVVVVCAGWTGVWFYAADFAGKRIDQVLAREASLGRKWTCTGREIAGFPFRFAVRCAGLRLSAHTPRGPVEADFGPVRAMVQIYNPKLVLAEADGPLNASLPGKVKVVKARFAAFRASIRTARPVPERISLRIEKLAGEATTANGVAQPFELAAGEFHMRPAPDVVAAMGAIDLAVRVQDLSASIIDTATRIAGPANADATLRITRAPAMLGGRRKPDLESWRQANGVLTVQATRLSKGPVQIEASGRLEIDDERRLAGMLNTRTAGAGSLLQQFGLAGGRTAISGILGGLLGGKDETAQKKPDKQVFLPMPLTLRDGFVWVGPIRTKVRLLPLY